MIRLASRQRLQPCRKSPVFKEDLAAEVTIFARGALFSTLLIPRVSPYIHIRLPKKLYHTVNLFLHPLYSRDTLIR